MQHNLTEEDMILAQKHEIERLTKENTELGIGNRKLKSKLGSLRKAHQNARRTLLLIATWAIGASVFPFVQDFIGKVL